MNTEISALMKQDNKMYEWAEKVQYNVTLSSEEKDISQVVDAWAKEIGKTGRDNEGQIAAFIQRVIEPEVYNAPDELLDLMFNRGTLGEFDYKTYDIAPKNTLVVHEAAKGGTVDKSFIDIGQATPTHRHLQGEALLRYSDLRRDGFKTIARLSTYLRESLRNDLFYDLLAKVDAAIAGGDQLITETSANPTMASMDALSAYLNDYSDGAPLAVTLSKYATAIGSMSGFNAYMTDEMKSKLNRTGIIDLYKGVQIAQISGARKQANGNLLLPDKRIFGFGGKIGDLDMRGELRVYEGFDNKNETVEIKMTGFEYDVAITNIEKMAKIVLA